uniref:ATP synthase complex subunit 8 n=1 Tax=Otolithes ruber TaxID=334907 RepID=A0A1P8SCA3_9TELE|nr:ATP synthase F0 subunit 8 [Otolithes ruber]APY18423.1 ATP synthase F0 subunit 8 [Otolithes ruber]
MPQLNPSPWLAIMIFSWMAFLIFIPPKVMTHLYYDNPTPQNMDDSKMEIWHWPWP